MSFSKEFTNKKPTVLATMGLEIFVTSTGFKPVTF